MCHGGGGIIAPGFTKIIRSPYNTNTGYLVYDKIEKLGFDMSLVDKFINEIGYTGLFSMEFIRGKDGRDYFLEINMRNDGNSYCVTAAGCNLPFAFYQYMASGSRMSFSKHVRRTYLIPDLIDLSVARQQGVSLLKWVIQFMSADAHTLFSWKDMGPFLYSLKPHIKRLLLK